VTQGNETGRDPDEDELRRRLRAIEAEHTDLLANTMGLSTIGNPDLIGKSRELERDADELRVRLGEPPRNPPEPTRRTSIFGWLALAGAIVAILAVVLLLPR
jgi:hypothetical protein